MSDVMQAQYESLQQVSKKFAQESSDVQQTLQQVGNRMKKLQETWNGLGSEAFFAEMGDEVLPATKRLQQALNEAASKTNAIAQLIKQAENEAAGCFR